MMKELFSDEELIQRIINNDSIGLELLFKRYYAQLVRFAKEILKNKDQAEDMVQEVFTKIWERREKLQINSQVKSYLYVAVKNHCFNQLKLNDRKHWMDEDMEDDMRISTPDSTSMIDAKTLEQKIQLAIEALPPKCGLIFKMSRFEEKSYKEIAEALELSIKTVENQMGKALYLMRASLAPYTQIMSALFLSIGTYFLSHNWGY
jgi:RNA polymerase sigma-70 factor (family 1)